MRVIILFAAAVGLTAGTLHAGDVPGVSGRWYMEGEEDGVYIQYVVDRSSEGKFRAEIRTPKRCERRTGWIETGSWSFRDGTLYNRTEVVDGVAVDPEDPEYQDSFIITVIDDDHARAFDTETKITWDMRRVTAEFVFPSLDDCSV